MLNYTVAIDKYPFVILPSSTFRTFIFIVLDAFFGRLTYQVIYLFLHLLSILAGAVLHTNALDLMKTSTSD